MKKLFLPLLMALLISATLVAQIKYNHSVSSGTFTPLVGGTTFTWLGSGTDDNYTASTPIGFTFNYNGEPFTEFQVSTEGFIRLGTGLASSVFGNALNGTVRRVIAPFWDDLNTDSLNYITFQVSGTTPNQVLTVEWKDVKWPRTNTTGNVRFQAKLYENDGKIEFVYGTFGPFSTTTGMSASIGLSDNTVINTANQASGTFLSIKMAGDPGNRVYHKSMGQEFANLNNLNVIDENTVFTFMPVTAAPLTAGTYTIGGATPDFASLSDAALALNTRGIAGAVTFNIRPGTYDDVFHLIDVAGTSETNTITVKNESGEVIISPKFGQLVSTAPGAIAGDAMFRLEGTSYTTIDGLKFFDNALNTTTTLKFNMGILVRNFIVNSTPLVNKGARNNTIKNVHIDLNALDGAVNVGAIPIRFGTSGTASTDPLAANSFNTIQDVVIEDFWRSGIQMYGHSGTNPDVGNSILGVNGRTEIKNVNITTGASNDIRAIEMNAQADLTIKKVDVMNIVSNVNTTNQVKGIWFNPASGLDFVSGNVLIEDVVINKIHNAAAGATSGLAVGFETGRMGPNSELTIRNCSISDIFANGTTGRAEGILISPNPQTGNNAYAYVYNNLVYDVRAPRSTTAPSVRGMDFQSTAGSLFAYVYFNTIFIDNAVLPTAATHQSSGIYWANYGTSSLELKNNIVVNTMVSGTRAAALYATANTNLIRLSPDTDNNLYYAGTPSPTNLIAWNGATGFQTLAEYKTAVESGGLGGPRETYSVTENPPFVNAFIPYNLNLQTTVPTRAEKGGSPIDGITADFAGTVRNALFPDLGAYEFNGIMIDENPPLMLYTVLANTHFTSNRQLVTTILDPSGIPTGTGTPRLYYKKSVNDTYVVDSTPTINGNQYTFTFNYSLLPGGSVSAGDTIFYYVAAQDSANNTGTNPVGGSGINPPGSTAPTAPRTYNILAAPLNGVYVVSGNVFRQLSGRDVEARIFEQEITGTPIFPALEHGLVDKNNNPVLENIPQTYVQQYEVLYENDEVFRGSKSLNDDAVQQAKNSGLVPHNTESVYATLSAAVSDLNTRGISGHVTFLLADTAYTTPTLQILITADSLTGPDRTVTFRPSVGVNTKITANSTNPVFIVASPYVTIDGSNAVESTTRNITIENTAVGASAGVGAFVSSNIIVKNIIGMTNSSNDGYGLLFSGATNGVAMNNWIKKTVLGIQAQSNSDNILVVDNEIGSTVADDAVRNAAIVMLSATNYTVSGNKILGTLRATGGDTYGISIGWQGAGFVSPTPGQVLNNTVENVKMTGVGGSAWAAIGIRLASDIAASNILVANNLVRDVLTGGDGSTVGVTYSANGIYIAQGGGYKVYYNSVSLSDSFLYTGATAIRSGAMTIVSGANVASLDIRNNIFVNNQTFPLATGTKKANAIFSALPNTIFTEINNNNYLATGADAELGFLGEGRLTLADWQTATGKDSSSKSFSPNFVSATDFRLQFPTEMYAAGTPVAEITTDFLGAQRSSTTPTIGAYENPLATIGWANLQWPPTASVLVGGFATVYAQIWIDGITNQPGPGIGIQAWIGVSDQNTDPSTWTTWIPAVYNVDAGNNDEYMADIGSTLPPGTYYYASRFNVFNGDYVYGGFSGGFWNGTTNVSGVLTVEPKIITLWNRSVADTTLPAWFGANNERGFAYGFIPSSPSETGNHRLFVVSRTGGNFVKILNAETGADVGELNTTGISGGTFAVSDAEVSKDGVIFVCNLTTNASTSPFKVYMWSNETAAPVEVFSYTASEAARLGDLFTVIGDYSAGTAQIWAGSGTTSANGKVYKWTMGGMPTFNPVPEIITLSDNAIGATPSISPLNNGDFYWNANAHNAKKYSANGTLIGTIPGGVIATGTNSIKFLGTVGTDEYIVTHQFGAGNNNARIVEVPNGNLADAFTYAITPTLGSAANANGSGDVAVKHNIDGSKDIFVLGTNNGIGAYRSTQSIPVELGLFTAAAEGRDVQLNWRTITESNTAGFEVERNAGSEWQKVGYVSAAGNSTEPINYSFKDSQLDAGTYGYRLRIVDLDGTFAYSPEVEVEVGVPMVYAMSQNYPNPFNPTTRISYQLPMNAKVTITLYSITGERVAMLVNEELTAGYHTLDVDASSLRLASGVYLYRMIATDLNGGNFVDSKKMMMLK